MQERVYKASLSQTQGRTGFCVTFRHPVRRDPATGKPGLRVRRGLGTRDRAEAERLRQQLDKLLAEPRFHDAAARGEAERLIGGRAVEIFFDGMVAETPDYLAIRDAALPLPDLGSDGYHKVVLLGTTGAGKTTLVRQIIGTDPDKERFPSTSTAKTTVHDTEIVFADGPWQAVVTFASGDEVREYLGECIADAVLSSVNGAGDAEILRRILNHKNQRYRFSYVLGMGPKEERGSADLDEFDDEIDAEDDESDDAEPPIDTEATDRILTDAIRRCRELGARLIQEVRKDLAPQGAEEERVADELLEDGLESLLREEDEFHALVDELMDEIEKRYESLPPGEVRRSRQGWPLSWTGSWPEERRAEFIRAISRFSSNHARHFGRLLTPLVNGLRVQGPFEPTWAEGGRPKLVLLDGEGLGHTPSSSTSVSTSVSRRIDQADVVLLVDSAAQPMQAAPVSAMRTIVVSGNAEKLVFAFTHFDQVAGVNLPTAAAKVDHVLASAENVFATFGQDLGPYAERALRQRLAKARFFLANIHQPLTGGRGVSNATITQLRRLLNEIAKQDSLAVAGQSDLPGRPMYELMGFVLPIAEAATAFLATWRARLGLQSRPGITKEHWTRIKALSRRLATGLADEYDTLRPIADLYGELQRRIYVAVQSPSGWTGKEPSDEHKQACFEAIARALGASLLEICGQRLWLERSDEWQDAYSQHGTGSTFERAKIIEHDIYEEAAPIPGVAPSPTRNLLLNQVMAAVKAALDEAGAAIE